VSASEYAFSLVGAGLSNGEQQGLQTVSMSYCRCPLYVVQVSVEDCEVRWVVGAGLSNGSNSLRRVPTATHKCQYRALPPGHRRCLPSARRSWKSSHPVETMSLITVRCWRVGRDSVLAAIIGVLNPRSPGVRGFI
jgi:hypothetical protein